MFSRFKTGHLYQHKGNMYVCTKNNKGFTPSFRTFPDLKLVTPTISLVKDAVFVIANVPCSVNHKPKTRAKITAFIQEHPELFI